MKVIVSGTEEAAKLARMLRTFISAAELIDANIADVEDMKFVVADLESDPPTLHDLKHEAIHHLVLALIRNRQGNVSAAARDAESDRGIFHRLLKRYGINAHEYRSASARLKLEQTQAKKRETERANHG